MTKFTQLEYQVGQQLNNINIEAYMRELEGGIEVSIYTSDQNPTILNIPKFETPDEIISHLKNIIPEIFL